MDKASQHYKTKKVIKDFEEDKETLIPVSLPTAFTEFMVIEEVWKIAKRDPIYTKILFIFYRFEKQGISTLE